MSHHRHTRWNHRHCHTFALRPSNKISAQLHWGWKVQGSDWTGGIFQHRFWVQHWVGLVYEGWYELAWTQIVQFRKWIAAALVYSFIGLVCLVLSSTTEVVGLQEGRPLFSPPISGKMTSEQRSKSRTCHSMKYWLVKHGIPIMDYYSPHWLSEPSPLQPAACDHEVLPRLKGRSRAIGAKFL